jgi:hypothetical protein
MAKVILDPMIASISGRVGDQIFKRVGNRTIVTRRPDMSHVVFSEAQLAYQERFRRAIAYLKMVRANPDLRAPYERAATLTDKTVHQLAVADFMRAPVIDKFELKYYAGRVSDPIVIDAHDDFEVAEVRLRIAGLDDVEIEQGPAVANRSESGRWVYIARAAVAPGTRIFATVTVSDHAGNRTEALIAKTV